MGPFVFVGFGLGFKVGIIVLGLELGFVIGFVVIGLGLGLLVGFLIGFAVCAKATCGPAMQTAIMMANLILAVHC